MEGGWSVPAAIGAVVAVWAAVALALLLSQRGWPSALHPLSRRVLLVIAHPDDEAMFFVPALHSLAEAGATVGVLCLSNGERRRGRVPCTTA